jgi:hypothetical protein
MRSIDRLVSHLASVLLCVCVASCATSSASLERAWRATDARPGELRYIATLFVSNDPTLRRVAEDRMANALRARGIRAVPSYVLLGAAPIDRDSAFWRLGAARIDGLVAMRVVETGVQRRLASRDVFEGGFTTTRTEVVEETVVQVETSAISVRTQRVLWSSMSKSVAPDSVSELVNDVSKIVTRELEAQGLVSA